MRKKLKVIIPMIMAAIMLFIGGALVINTKANIANNSVMTEDGEVIIKPQIDYFVNEKNNTIPEEDIIPINNTYKSIKEVKIGDYIKYIPKNEEYVIKSSETGEISDQTFVPKDTTNWIVFENNGKVEIINDGGIGSLTLKGGVGYKNAVKVLNDLSKQYINSEYAIAARSVGSTSNSISQIASELKYGYNNDKYMDSEYNADVAKIRQYTILKNSESIWLASRNLESDNNWYKFFVRSIMSVGEFDDSNLYSISQYGTVQETSYTRGVRVVVTLGNDVEISGGTGTKADPYILKESEVIYGEHTAPMYPDPSKVTEPNKITYYPNTTDTVILMPRNEEKPYGASMVLPDTDPIREGYKFNGWNTEADGTGKAYSTGEMYTHNKDLTLYAQWVKDPEIVSKSSVIEFTWDTTGQLDKSIIMTVNGGYEIFWGDGWGEAAQKHYPSQVKEVTLSHNYKSEGKYTVEIKGDNISTLQCDNNKIISLNVSNNTKLTSLDCGVNELKELDVSNNTRLTSLRCDDNQLAKLEIGKNVALEELYCHKNLLEELDVSNNTNLKILICWDNKLQKLDLSSNVILEELRCHSNLLNSLDVSNNIELEWLDCTQETMKELIVGETVPAQLEKHENTKIVYVDEDIQEIIEKLVDLKVMNLYEDGSFKSKNTMTKAEMAVILCKMVGIDEAVCNEQGKVPSRFSDVNVGEWYTGYVNVAAGKGLLANLPDDGTFRPNDTITLNEVLTLCVNALGRSEYVSAMGVWPANYIVEATKLGLLEGVKTSTPNRGNIAIIVWNTLKAPYVWDVTSTDYNGTVSLDGSGKSLLSIYFKDKVEYEPDSITDVKYAIVSQDDYKEKVGPTVNKYVDLILADETESQTYETVALDKDYVKDMGDMLVECKFNESKLKEAALLIDLPAFKKLKADGSVTNVIKSGNETKLVVSFESGKYEKNNFKVVGTNDLLLVYADSDSDGLASTFGEVEVDKDAVVYDTRNGALVEMSFKALRGEVEKAAVYVIPYANKDAQGENIANVLFIVGTKSSTETPIVPEKLQQYDFASYKDIRPGDWYYDSEVVKFVTEKGYINGLSEKEFGPDLPMTRGQFISMLYNMAGKPEVAGTSSFKDVKSSHNVDAIVWGNKVGLMSGYPDGTFKPDASIDREQVVTVLKKYADYVGRNTNIKAELNKFGDYKDIYDWAYDAVSWAIAKEIMKGDNYNRILPHKSATRAEVAAMLKNFETIK